MSEKEYFVDRKTYVNGRLKGQYQGYQSRQAIGNANEKIYDLELLRGEIFAEKITRWDEVDQTQFLGAEEFKLKLPDRILLNLLEGGVYRQYEVELFDVHFISYHLGNHQVEGTEVFGDITVNVVGYFIHPDKVTVEEYEQILKTTEKEVDDEGAIVAYSDRTDAVQAGYKTTVKKLPDGRFDFSATRIKGSRYEKFWSWIGVILNYLLFGLIMLPILAAGWPIILGFFGVLALLWLLSFVLGFLLRRRSFLWSILGVIFGLFLLSNVLSLLKTNVIERSGSTSQHDLMPSPKPVEQTEQQGQLLTGKDIKHRLKWTDYDQNIYEGTISVHTKDWFEAKNLRNSLPYPLNTAEDYNNISRSLYNASQLRMDGIYYMFDSIIAARNPSRQTFAEIVVSCVQNIPYYLILPGACNAQDYSPGEFAYEYLSEDGACIENVKYGVLGPVEFAATLYGDCDTRTLLLYTILKHYGYNTMMMVSLPLQHAVLAVELPNIEGNYFKYRNRRFMWWETTKEGVPPGMFPLEYSQPQLWDISLI